MWLCVRTISTTVCKQRTAPNDPHRKYTRVGHGGVGRPNAACGGRTCTGIEALQTRAGVHNSLHDQGNRLRVNTRHTAVEWRTPLCHLVSTVCKHTSSRVLITHDQSQFNPTSRGFTFSLLRREGWRIVR